MPTISYATCPLCEAACGLRVEHDGRRISRITGDASDPMSAGYLCPKALALPDLHRDPDRITQPLRRTSSGWQPIGWEQALDEVGRRTRA